MSFRTWRNAMDDALYGDAGFYRTHAPHDHFRTSVHASPLFASAVAALAREVGATRVVDLGAGRGELLVALHALDPALSPAGVEIAARPAGLPEAIDWQTSFPAEFDGLVIANEWLDNVPVDVAEVDDDGTARLVEVDESGSERLGAPVSEADAKWLSDWWPSAEPGARAEIGWPRDAAWSTVISRLSTGGSALAVDYAHALESRPFGGTLAGYRDGSVVRPVPDGSCDLTAHVAIDAVAAAGRTAGAMVLEFTTQREALRRRGLDARRPDLSLARDDPRAYLRALNRTGEAAELLDPEGLGGFSWLLQRKS